MTKANRNRARLPPIYVDEHLSSEVADGFREAGFRVIEVKKNPALVGRDERDYLPQVRAERGVFVTSDRQYVTWLRDSGERHTGTILLPEDWDGEGKVAVAGVLAYTLKSGLETGGSMVLRGLVLVPRQDGLYYSKVGTPEQLLFSWVSVFGPFD